MSKSKNILFVGVPAPEVAEPTKEESEFWRAYLALAYLKGTNGIPEEKLPDLGNSINIYYGIASLGKQLREAGHNVGYVAPKKDSSDADFIEEVVRLARNFEVIGLSYHTCGELTAREIAERVKEENPEVKVLAGGPHCAGLDCVDSEKSPIDLYVRGRAHASLPFILDNLEEVIESHQDEKIFRREETPLEVEREFNNYSFPVPDASLFDAEEIPGARVYTQVGCGKKVPCGFCASLNNHRIKEYANLDEVFEYIDDLIEQKGTVYLYIGDEDFFMTPDHSLEVVRRLDAYKGKLTYSIQARIETIRSSVRKSPPLLEKLGEQGMCTKIEVGVESASQKILNISQKGLRVSHLEDVADLVHSQGMLLGTYWLGGLPGETEETYRHTTSEISRLLREGIIDFAESTQVVPFPGTPLYDEREKFRSKGVEMQIYSPSEIGGNCDLEDCQLDKWRGENKPVFDLHYSDGTGLSREQMRDLYVERIGEMSKAIQYRIETGFGADTLNQLMNPIGVDPLRVMSGF